MAVQFPQRTIEEQTAAYQSYAANTLFPYSYPFVITPSAGAFSKSYTPISGNYMTVGFQADNNLAISAMDVQYSFQLFKNVTNYTANLIIEVSYSPQPNMSLLTVTATPPAIPTPVVDFGNIIYRNNQQIFVTSATIATYLTLDDFRRYEPYNYLLKYNQILYIHFIVDATTAGLNVSTLYGSIIFHTLPTGLKI